ncbi:MAG TPA: phenylacetate--CoA ligase family protein [Polyangiaceae bacterium]|nr:phenylacetate--CoA ligase family protein [Polyangiaceae bacterium]
MTSLSPKSERARAAFDEFLARDLDEVLTRCLRGEPARLALELFRRTAASVPAYKAFLSDHGISPEQAETLDDLASVPVTTKENYHRRHSLDDLSREGRLSDCDMLAVSSGSTGEPGVWPRFSSDELQTSVRFEQVLVDAMEVTNRRTLGVVCFALGTWVGGMYTTACCRHLASKGYPLTLVTPGNQKAEILRVLRALAPAFDQIVLFGYPPFLKDVVDSARGAGFDWSKHRVRLVMAGEVFSEAWRSSMCERLGAADPALTTASLYGTADGGVLANETPLSIRIRRALAERPEAARALFGEARLPTLCQYDPCHRFFEVESDGSLLFTGDGGIPLVRYKILDRGGIVEYRTMLAFLKQHGVALPELGTARELPFVFVFGRSNFAVSFYGANVYPENVAAGVERPEFAEDLTGKFVLEVVEDTDQNPRLSVAVELAAGKQPDESLSTVLAATLREQLEHMNSEFLNYAPAERRTPLVRLLPQGHPEYFPLGVKHRYSRA